MAVPPRCVVSLAWMVTFFFSSRRRHTRCSRDWSSDVCSSDLGAGAIYIGAVAEDSSGYPDCRPEYYRVFQELIRVGTRPETQVRIVTPVIEMKKSEIVRRGLELGAPLDLTWSCYQEEDRACGVCDSCLLRLRAFAEAGASDAIPYRRAVPASRRS